MKALLENPNLLLPPPPVNNNNNINADGDAAKGDKDDLFLYDSEAVDMAAAFLGPTLWDRTLPSDSDLKLEYMDIDEFLAENGIQVNNAEKENKSDDVVPTIEPPLTPPDEMAPSPYRLSMTTPPQTPVMVDSQSAPDNVTIGVPATPTSPGVEVEKTAILSPVTPPSPNSPTSPVTPPSPVNVDVAFSLSSSDVALATAPGQNEFNPREKTFSEEELKPQPMVKKSKKQYVPEELKDDKYWERRRKNNIAAKRSRDARRVKENQIVIRTSFLEKENTALKNQVYDLKKENQNYKKLLASYEKKLQALNAL